MKIGPKKRFKTVLLIFLDLQFSAFSVLCPFLFTIFIPLVFYNFDPWIGSTNPDRNHLDRSQKFLFHFSCFLISTHPLQCCQKGKSKSSQIFKTIFEQVLDNF